MRHRVMTVRRAFFSVLLLWTLGPAMVWAQSPASGSPPASTNAVSDNHSARHDDKGGKQSEGDAPSDEAHGHASDKADDGRGGRRDDKGDHEAAADQRHEKGHVASAAHNNPSKPSWRDRRRTAEAGTGIGGKAGRAPRFIPKADHAPPGLAVPGNAVARRTAVKPGMGGPTPDDPKKHELAILGGTAMARNRRF
jgi:hypothetical protein